MYKNSIIFFSFFLIFGRLGAEEVNREPEKPKTESVEERTSDVNGTVMVDGTPIAFKATTGNLILKDEKGKQKASIFYIAYTKDKTDLGKRPITFCFNGGPGSSSVWLHLGMFGPKRVALSDDLCAMPTYELVDNEYSILDVTDLVFIDPVSTGYSRAVPGEDPKQFHGVDEDIKSVADFIRLYTTRNDRWQSPKYIAGESYGTTRAAGLARHLHDEHYMYVDGIMLISSVLNFQTFHDWQGGNDLPYILYLPSFTATAWFHKKLPPELQSKSLEEVLKEVEHFALTDYTLALMQGDVLSSEARAKTIQQLALFTGLSPEFIDGSNLRINSSYFRKELLRSQRRTVGRFDSRFLGIDSSAVGAVPEGDPSFDALIGSFTSAFNQYVREDLKWKQDEEYQILANVNPWDYSKAATNQYLNMGESLREVMTRNPCVKVFVASGYYDLATPYFATDYTFDHLGLDPSLRSHTKTSYYEAGHMMYIYPPALIALKKDIQEFYEQGK
jgi:carboxypeptidase C (cathepsin A)